MHVVTVYFIGAAALRTAVDAGKKPHARVTVSYEVSLPLADLSYSVIGFEGDN